MIPSIIDKVTARLAFILTIGFIRSPSHTCLSPKYQLLKAKKNQIFVHHTAVAARFVLNDSKERLFYFYLLYTLFD